ncbi:MAG: hypothetical protein KGK30_01805, partial [Elusimicrobia bacterium]|nr:hypothetical protein [Elusimicrobiota bacterium]
QDGSLRQWDGGRDRWTDWPARPGCGPPRVELSAGRDFAAVERSCGGKPLVCVRRIEDGALLARQALPGGARLYAVSRDGKRLLALEGRRLSEYAVPGGAVARSWLLPAGVRPVFPPLLDPSWRWLAARRSGRLLRLDLSGPVASLRVLPGGG